MRRMISLLLANAAAVGLIVYAAWHPGLWEPWLEAQGIGREDPEFRRGAKIILAVVWGLPLTALIYEIGRLGSDRSKKDVHGYTVLRLRAGTRWFMTISCLGLAALFIAYPMVDPEAPFPWVFVAAAMLWLLAIPVALRAKVRFDETTLSVSDNFGGQKVYQWSDLSDVREVPEKRHYLFSFRTGKKASVSFSYAGLGELIRAADAKMGAHS